MIRGSSYLFVSYSNYGEFNPDPVIESAHNAVLVYKLSRHGTLDLVQILRHVSGPNQIIVADFNRDGKLDLAVASSKDDSVTFFRGNGNGTFREDSNVYVQTVDGGPAYPVGLAAGHFNADPALDLAVADNGNGVAARTINVLRNTSAVGGRIVFKSAELIPIGQDLINIVAVHLGDALPGLAVTSSSDDRVYVLHNQRKFRFGNPEPYEASQPVGIIAARITGGSSAKPKSLVVVNSGNDSLSIFQPV
jgi:hypothetical protein